MKGLDNTDTVIKKKSVENYPVIIRLYSIEYVDELDLDLVFSLHFEESEVYTISSLAGVSDFDLSKDIGTSESELLMIVSSMDTLRDLTEYILKEDLDRSCAVCDNKSSEMVNLYQVVDYAVPSHTSCMEDLSVEALDFCENCPELLSRTI